MYKRKWFGLLWICIFIFSFMLKESFADFSEQLIETDIGFRGKCKMGEMLPVKVTLTSFEEDIQGDLIIKTHDKKYIHSIELAAYTKKSLSYSIPWTSPRESLEVYVRSNDEIIEKQSLKVEALPRNTVFVGVFSDRPERMNALKEIDSLLFSEYKVEVISLNSAMDYTSSEMASINFIWIDNFNVAGMSPESQQRLKKWIEAGNTVMVGKGQYAYKTLSGIFEGMEESQKMGAGWVVVLPFDLEGKERDFMKSLLEEWITPIGLNKFTASNKLQQKIQESRKLYGIADQLMNPSYSNLFFWIALLCIYLLLLGISVFINDRFKVLCSLTIFSFSILFYAIGLWGGVYRTKAVSTAVNLYNENREEYRITNIYPYKQLPYRVHISNVQMLEVLEDGEAVVDPIERTAYLSGQNKQHFFSVLQEDFKKEALTLSLEAEGVLKGYIKNPLPHKMDHCFLLIGNTIIPIGELDGKESVEIDYQLDNALNNQGDYNYLSYIYEKADLKSYQRQLLDYYFYQIEDGRNILKLFGFSKEERELQVDRKVQHVQQIALNVFDISMENNEGIVFSPMGAIQPIMLQNEGSENPHRKETLLEAGKDKILYYVLPKEMLISEIQIIAKGEGSDFGIEVFNHTSHRWQPLSNKVLEQGYIEALGIKGLFLLKVEGNGRMILPQISLKGRK